MNSLNSRFQQLSLRKKKRQILSKNLTQKRYYPKLKN